MNLSFYRKLGRTDLNVSCLGIGGGGGIKSDDTLYAFDRGINFFFFSSDFHHAIYSHMSEALRQLCSRRSSVREKVVLATATYIKNPDVAVAALHDQFYELGIDYVDIFFWGWIGTRDRSSFSDCMQLSNGMRGPNSLLGQTIEKIFGVSERLKKMGAVRYIGASFHDLELAQEWLDSPLLDVVMVRHNAAYRSAQNKVFARLNASDSERPGIVTFKSTGLHTGPMLWNPPKGLPKTCWQPSVPDLYRYSLTQNCVDVCLTGFRHREEIDAAIAGVEKGKLSAVEIDYLNLYGDLHHDRISIQNVPLQQLLYCN
jgi:predicted aldo/keto reductase-like oxidoreductase